jgi:hypothetical protein
VPECKQKYSRGKHRRVTGSNLAQEKVEMFFSQIPNKDKYGRKKMWYGSSLICWRPWVNSIEPLYYKMHRDTAKITWTNMGNEVGERVTVNCYLD